VAVAALGEVQGSLFAAGAALGEVQVSLFEAGAALGDFSWQLQHLVKFKGHFS